MFYWCLNNGTKYAHPCGGYTLTPDGFRNFDSLRRIADRAMRPKTTHKQFLMSGQWFQVNLSRFQRKWVPELLKTSCASVSAAWWSTFSMTLKHVFRWNRSECNLNHCLDIRNCLWSVCVHIVPWMIPWSASNLPKPSGASVPAAWMSIFGTIF